MLIPLYRTHNLLGKDEYDSLSPKPSWLTRKIRFQATRSLFAIFRDMNLWEAKQFAEHINAN